MSLHTQNSSANRGACVQNCRRTYIVKDKEDGHEFEIDNEFIMSPKDLCTLDFLDQLIDTGVNVLKIGIPAYSITDEGGATGIDAIDSFCIVVVIRSGSRIIHGNITGILRGGVTCIIARVTIRVIARKM